MSGGIDDIANSHYRLIRLSYTDLAPCTPHIMGSDKISLRFIFLFQQQDFALDFAGRQPFSEWRPGSLLA